MRKRSDARAFTLVELMVTTVIAALLLSSILWVLWNHMYVFRFGEQSISLQGEMSKVLSILYLDIKRINSRLYTDRQGDVWAAGEKTKEIKPNTVELFDTDQNRANGFERLRFHVYRLDRIGAHENVEYHLADSSPLDTEGATIPEAKRTKTLIRDLDGQKTQICDRMTGLSFQTVPGDGGRLLVRFSMRAAESPGLPEKNDSIEVGIRFDTDYATIREAVVTGSFSNQ